MGAASAGGRPWEALLVLLRAELRRLPRSYPGTLVVDAYLVDLATATGRIGVISAALDDLRAALASYCTAGHGPVAEYQIGDRRMKFRSTTEIADLIAYYERQVALERGGRHAVYYRG